MGIKQDIEFSFINKYIWTHSTSQLVRTFILINFLKYFVPAIILLIILGFCNIIQSRSGAHITQMQPVNQGYSAAVLRQKAIEEQDLHRSPF